MGFFEVVTTQRAIRRLKPDPWRSMLPSLNISNFSLLATVRNCSLTAFPLLAPGVAALL